MCGHGVGSVIETVVVSKPRRGRGANDKLRRRIVDFEEFVRAFDEHRRVLVDHRLQHEAELAMLNARAVVGKVRR
jgi:hypothetical protein